MILAILQARVSSTRLPNKVLQPILGKPMLAYQIERINHSRLIDKLIIATSTDVSDNPLVDLCKTLQVDFFRGQLQDVLDRFYKAAYPFNPAHVVRLTGDCPLCDWQLIDQVIEYHLAQDFDYTTNTLEPTYPDGLDVEIFRFQCLETAWKEAKLPSQREHVTPFIHQQPERFKLGNYKNNLNLSHLRWTVDEALDFALVNQIYAALYPSNSDFTTKDILDLLEANPSLKTYNTQYQRNEGYLKSLLADEKLLS